MTFQAIKFYFCNSPESILTIENCWYDSSGINPPSGRYRLSDAIISEWIQGQITVTEKILHVGNSYWTFRPSARASKWMWMWCHTCACSPLSPFYPSKKISTTKENCWILLLSFTWSLLIALSPGEHLLCEMHHSSWQQCNAFDEITTEK